MFNPLGLFRRCVTRGWPGLLVALALAFNWPSSALAQTQILTLGSANFLNLQSDLAYSTNTRIVICNFNGTIAVTSPLLISGNIILEASTNYSVTLNGTGGLRLFQVQPGVTLTISNLTLSGGNYLGTAGVNATPAVGNQGAAGVNGTSGGSSMGGAIYNLGTNYLYSCIFLTNSAEGGNAGNGGNGATNRGGVGGNGGSGGNGGLAYGGAIYNQGFLVMSNCTMAGNFVFGGSGGVAGTNGGGISGPGVAGAGGTGANAYGAAIYNAGKAYISASTFFVNVAQGGNSQTAGPSGNSPGINGATGGWAEGGGIYNVGTNVLINCTFATNSCIGGAGGNGGIALYGGGGGGGNGGDGGLALGGSVFVGAGGITSVTNCTLVGGSVTGGTNGLPAPGGQTGAIGVAFGGNIGNSGGTFQLKNSILTTTTSGLNSYGAIVDQGYNLSSDTTPLFSKPSTSLTNQVLMLGGLTTNGGFTLTIAPFETSPAVDAIPANNSSNYPPFDQRGYPRPIGPAVDIGAVELGTPTFSISGYLLPSSSAYTNVLILAVGTGSSYGVFPDTNGYYEFDTLSPDMYNIIPQATNGFTFGPIMTNVTVGIGLPSISNVDFTTTPAFMIGGYITNLTTFASSATVFIYSTVNGNNTFYTQTTTDTNHVYTFTNIPAGNFTIIPQQTASVGFSPGTILTNVSVNNTNINLTAVPPYYPVSGQVTGASGNLITVVANLNGSPAATVVTDSGGSYTFQSLNMGSYVIQPLPTNNLTFSPANLAITVTAATNLPPFVASGTASYSISGQISNYRGSASLSAVSGANTYMTSSGTNGAFSFGNVASGNYTVTPTPGNGVTFSPTSLPETVSPSQTNAFFSAIPTSRPTNSVHLANQTLDFSLSGAPDVIYRIQFSTNLMTWENVETNATDSTGSLDLSFPTTIYTNGFFRAVTP
jgi:hypothetical protein